MRLIAFVLGITTTIAYAGEPDIPPREEMPIRVPAPVLSPAEEARRDALTRFGLGFFRTRDDRLVEAMKQYRAAWQNDPQAVAPQRELVKVYAELGRDAAAIRAARAVLAKDPDDAETAQRLGRLLVDGKKHAEAAKAFQQAAASPRGKDDFTARLVLLRELGNAGEKANDHAAREIAAREQLAILTANRAALLKPDLFSPEEFHRRRARCYEDLGQALVGLRKFDSASAAFETARDLYADPKAANDRSGVARLNWNLSGSLAAQGESEKALKELERYLEQQPVGFAPYERWVKLMTETNRGSEIAGTLTRQAKLNPTNPAPLWLAAAATLQRDPEAGDAAFAKLLDRADKPDHFRVMVQAYESANLPEKFLAIADRLFTAGRPKGYYDEHKDKAPDPPPPSAADLHRARFFSEAAKATKTFTKPLIRQLEADGKAGGTRFPDTLELVMGLATRDGQLESFTPALRSVSGRKINYSTQLMVVICLRHQRKWDEIAAIAESLSNLNNGRFSLSIAAEAAIAYAELGREREALAVLDKLDGRIYIRVKRSEVFNILGQPKIALRELEDVLEKDNPKGDNLEMVRRAQINTLHLLKEDAKAERLLRELLDDNPDNVLILNNFGYQLADQGRKLDEAEAMIRRAIELDRDARIKAGDPDAESGNYSDSLGWVLFKKGKFAEARKALEAATQFAEVSENGVVWDHLGDTYFRLDLKKEAVAAYAKALKLFTGSHEGKQFGRLDEVKRKLKLAE